MGTQWHSAGDSQSQFQTNEAEWRLCAGNVDRDEMSTAPVLHGSGHHNITSLLPVIGEGRVEPRHPGGVKNDGIDPHLIKGKCIIEDELAVAEELIVPLFACSDPLE